MLARYRIVRGRRPPDDPLPDGLRIDTRKHTRHFLRPDAERVAELLSAPSDPNVAAKFRAAYLELLERRFAADPASFEALADKAREGDVYLGCSCPTKGQPDVQRCHTVLALEFFREHFDDLDVVVP